MAKRDSYLKSYDNILYLNKFYYLTKSKEYKRFVGGPSRLSDKPVAEGFAILLVIVFFPFYVLKESIHYARKKEKNSKRFIDAKRVFLYCFNSALYRVSVDNRINITDAIWLVNSKNDISADVTKITFFSLITYKDIFGSFIDSLIAFYKSLFIYGIKVVYIGLDSFSWFLKYRIGLKIPVDSEILFCNHFDKMAALINSLPQTKKTLIQHGTEILIHNLYGIEEPFLKKNSQYNIWTFNLPNKYTSLDKIISFSEKEYVAMCQAFVDGEPQKEIVGYNLKTTRIGAKSKTILIIGFYRNYYEQEKEIISEMQKYDVDIILKNHPTQNPKVYDSLLKNYDFIFLDEPIYPSADIVISYDSTLALQYEDKGYKVLLYDDYDMPSIIKEIKQSLCI